MLYILENRSMQRHAQKAITMIAIPTKSRLNLKYGAKRVSLPYKIEYMIYQVEKSVANGFKRRGIGKSCNRGRQVISFFRRLQKEKVIAGIGTSERNVYFL